VPEEEEVLAEEVLAEEVLAKEEVLAEEVLAEEVLAEKEDDGAKELLMDFLINKACKDKNILKELIIIQKVFNSMQRLLSY
jgi:hypothetical protein